MKTKFLIPLIAWALTVTVPAAQSIILLGTAELDNDGDTAFAAFTKVNNNFTEIYTTLSGITTNATHTGDATGATALTLATVATAGTTGSSTAIPVVTINAKGLTTGITTAAVVAPAGTLTGTALASNVVTSSLTSFGTITTLTATTTNATNLVITLSTPSSATATGVAGTIRVDANYIYVCVATDTWKRVAIATW